MANASLHCTRSNTIDLSDESTASEWITSPRVVSIVTIALPTVGCFGVLSNMAVLFVFARIRRMQTVTNLYLANWAVADILFLLSGINLLMWVYLFSPISKNIPAKTSGGCWGFYTMAHIAGAVSTYMATLIAYERYSAVTSPIKSRVLNTKQRTGKLIVITWIVAILASLVYMTRYAYLAEWCIVWPANSTYHNLPTVFHKCVSINSTFFIIAESSMGLIFYIILFINGYLYYMIIRALKASKRINSDYDSNSTQIQIMDSAQRRVTKVLLINGRPTVFFLCQVLPRARNILNVFFYFGILFKDDKSEFLYHGDDNLFPILGGALMFLQSAVNPLIYTFGSALYRASFVKAFSFRSKQKPLPIGTIYTIESKVRNISASCSDK